MKSTIILALALTMHVTTASASNWYECKGKITNWDNDVMYLKMNTTSIPKGSKWESATISAANAWNNVKGSNLTIKMGYDEDGTVNKSNGINEIYFSSDLGDQYAGTTYSRRQCYEDPLGKVHTKILETDIALNKNIVWTLSNTNPTIFGPYMFGLTVLHEIGHALGLAHEDRVLNTMFPDYPSGGPIGVDYMIIPHADDRVGLRRLYPGTSSGIDLAASAYRNEYGMNLYTTVTDYSTGKYSSKIVYNNPYNVNYTIENLGTTTEKANVYTYLSKDRYASPDDYYLGGAVWSLPPGSTFTAAKMFFINNGIPEGDYYVVYEIRTVSGASEVTNKDNKVSQAALVNVGRLF